MFSHFLSPRFSPACLLSYSRSCSRSCSSMLGASSFHETNCLFWPKTSVFYILFLTCCVLLYDSPEDSGLLDGFRLGPVSKSVRSVLRETSIYCNLVSDNITWTAPIILDLREWHERPHKLRSLLFNEPTLTAAIIEICSDNITWTVLFNYPQWHNMDNPNN